MLSLSESTTYSRIYGVEKETERPEAERRPYGLDDLYSCNLVVRMRVLLFTESVTPTDSLDVIALDVTALDVIARL